MKKQISKSKNQTTKSTPLAKELIPSKDIESFDVFVDMKNANKNFSQYGHVLAPLLKQDESGKFSRDTEVKAWFQFSDARPDCQSAFRRWLPNSVTFYPHEEVASNIESILKNKEFNLTEIGQTYVSKDDRIASWKFLSPRTIEIPGSFEKNDKVGIGLLVRNGIHTNVALGLDMFTYRLVCSNGAIMKDHKLGSISIYHMGPFEEMQKKFKEAVGKVLDATENLIEYYKQSVKIMTTQRMAEDIWKKIHVEDYMPDYIKVIQEKGKKTEIKLTKQNVSYWQTFNDMTAIMNRKQESNKLGYRVFSNKTTALHKLMVAEIRRAKV